MQLDLGSGPVDLEISFWTLVVYEQEFGGNMIGDLFGKAELVEESSAVYVNGNGNIEIDYSQFDWTAGIRAMWAAARTHDSRTPAFATWARSMHGVDIWPIAAEFVDAVRTELFRPGATDSE